MNSWLQIKGMTCNSCVNKIIAQRIDDMGFDCQVIDNGIHSNGIHFESIEFEKELNLNQIFRSNRF
jgi:hypothetical protein